MKLPPRALVYGNHERASGRRNVASTAALHLLHVEDEWKEHRLPAGSVIIADSWAMLRYDKIHPDPLAFNPIEFIEGGKLDLAAKDCSRCVQIRTMVAPFTPIFVNLPIVSENMSWTLYGAYDGLDCDCINHYYL
ncbi:hypothetical protein FPV67DRAFT_1166815 [Lyophyllum atratum]|nr:hypothetical protein FPV67DRAFT_1166815 [Lyophyllum atratum]